MTDIEGPVVVGVDSARQLAPGDSAAVALAAWEAMRHRVGLHLVGRAETLAPWLRGRSTSAGDGPTRELFDRLIECTARAHPELAVTGALYLGSPASALVAASQDASVVIVAADARVHYGGLLAGPVSVQVAAHAASSVLVVPTVDAPGRSPGPGRVVVGVDGSAGSLDALAFAFDEAQARGAALHAIYVWESRDWPAAREAEADGAAVERMLRGATADWEDSYPEVAVIRGTVRGQNPVRGLDNAAAGADLVVVGCRGNGGFGALRLGSVSDGLVRYSARQVAVVRGPATDPTPRRWAERPYHLGTKGRAVVAD